MPNQSNYFSDNQDPYRNPKTGVLKNIPNMKTQAELDKFEELIFQSNSIEAGEYLKAVAKFGLDEWKRVHQICFSDIYDWAGKIRTIRISKDKTVFAYPENIEKEAGKLFFPLNELLSDSKLTLEKTAELFAEINVLHPFREGNGRTQRILFQEILRRVGYLVDYNQTTQKEMIRAMIYGYNAQYAPTIKLFEKISEKAK